MTKEHFIEWKDGISPWLMNHGLKILLILVGAFILNLVLKKITVRAIRIAIVSRNHGSEDSEVKREDTLIKIFLGILRISIILIATLMILAEMGLMIAPIIAGAGIVGLAVGFGGQYLIRDIISGFFIIIENQYRVGDVVNFDGTGGTVEDISIRMTTLRDLDGTIHHVPHGEIKKVANLSKNFSRVNLDIGVAYDSDMEKVKHVVNETGNALAADPEWKDRIIAAPQFLRVNKFDDSAIVIKVLGETQPSAQWAVSGEFRKRIKVAFDKAGIEFPFPQMVVHTAK